MKKLLPLPGRVCLPPLLLTLLASGTPAAPAASPFFGPAAWQADGPITGRVLDEQGGGLPGATVLVKGTTNGTSSGADGRFSLAGVPTGATLVISSVAT